MKKIKLKVIGAKDFYIVPEQFLDIKEIVGKKLKPVKAKIIGAKDFYIISEVFLPEGINPIDFIGALVSPWENPNPALYNFYSFGENPSPFPHLKRKILYSPIIRLDLPGGDIIPRDFKNLPSSASNSSHFHPRLVLVDMTRWVQEQPLNKWQAKIRFYFPSGDKWQSKIYANDRTVKVPINVFHPDKFLFNSYPQYILIKVYPWGDFPEEDIDINVEDDREVWMMRIKVDPSLSYTTNWITENFQVSSGAPWCNGIEVEGEIDGGNPVSWTSDLGTVSGVEWKELRIVSKTFIIRAKRTSPSEEIGYVRQPITLNKQIHTFVGQIVLPLDPPFQQLFLLPTISFPVWWNTYNFSYNNADFTQDYISDIGGKYNAEWDNIDGGWRKATSITLQRTSGNTITVHAKTRTLKYEFCYNDNPTISFDPSYDIINIGGISSTTATIIKAKVSGEQGVWKFSWNPSTATGTWTKYNLPTYSPPVRWRGRFGVREDLFTFNVHELTFDGNIRVGAIVKTSGNLILHGGVVKDRNGRENWIFIRFRSSSNSIFVDKVIPSASQQELYNIYQPVIVDRLLLSTMFIPLSDGTFFCGHFENANELRGIIFDINTDNFLYLTNIVADIKWKSIKTYEKGNWAGFVGESISRGYAVWDLAKIDTTIRSLRGWLMPTSSGNPLFMIGKENSNFWGNYEIIGDPTPPTTNSIIISPSSIPTCIGFFFGTDWSSIKVMSAERKIGTIPVEISAGSLYDYWDIGSIVGTPQFFLSSTPLSVNSTGTFQFLPNSFPSSLV
jgi:hypothetical protein